MTVDVTKPLEVVALEGAKEGAGTCWDAKYVRLTYSGNISTRTKAPRWVFKPTGEHSYGYPYRLRNKRAVIDLSTHPKDQIELEHIETGERVPCEADDRFWPEEVGEYRLRRKTPDRCRWFKADGTHTTGKSKWRIVAKRTEAEIPVGMKAWHGGAACAASYGGFVMDIPEWAIDRALSRFSRPSFISGEPWKPVIMDDARKGRYIDAVRFLAGHIAEHEEPDTEADTSEWWQRPELRERVVALLHEAKGGFPNGVNNFARCCEGLLAEIEPPKDALVEEIREQLGPKFKHLAPLVAEEHRKQLAKENNRG